MTYKYYFVIVPLATLISATKPPKPSPNENAILSPDGLKRFFVVHGGLFSKDEVTLEDIRKIPRIGRQPGQEGLMCEVRLCLGATNSFYWSSSCLPSYFGPTPKKSQVGGLVNG